MRCSYLGFSGFGHRAPWPSKCHPRLSCRRCRPGAKNQAGRCLRALLISPEGTPQGQWFVGAKRALPTFREATSEPLPRELAALRFHQRRFYLRAHNEVFKGVPPLTRFSCLLTCIKRQSSCGAETPPGMRPGAVPRQAHGSAQPLCPKLAGQVQTKAPRPKPGPSCATVKALTWRGKRPPARGKPAGAPSRTDG